MPAPVEHGIPESRDEGVGPTQLSGASACALWLLETSSGLMQTESKSQGLICCGSSARLSMHSDWGGFALDNKDALCKGPDGLQSQGIWKRQYAAET